MSPHRSTVLSNARVQRRGVRGNRLSGLTWSPQISDGVGHSSSWPARGSRTHWDCRTQWPMRKHGSTQPRHLPTPPCLRGIERATTLKEHPVRVNSGVVVIARRADFDFSQIVLCGRSPACCCVRRQRRGLGPAHRFFGAIAFDADRHEISRDLARPIDTRSIRNRFTELYVYQDQVAQRLHLTRSALVPLSF